MPRRYRSLTLAAAALLASLLVAQPGPVGADGPTPDLDHINLAYWGGPLIQNVKVVTLFWGPFWAPNVNATNLFNGFFVTLFAQGGYMANLAQYSTNGYQIGNGQIVGSDMDAQAPPDRVTDAQIQQEIEARIDAGRLPPPDADTAYFVFTPPNVVIVDRDGQDTQNDINGYHHSSQDTTRPRFAYAAIPFILYTDPQGNQSISGLMTVTCSHELAEIVTDPLDNVLSWYDTHNGEVADIVAALYGANRIDMNGLTDWLVAPDGTRYPVQKVWSNRDQAPVAFAP